MVHFYVVRGLARGEVKRARREWAEWKSGIITECGRMRGIGVVKMGEGTCVEAKRLEVGTKVGTARGKVLKSN